MADWKVQYLAALEARDDLEKAERRLYNHCTKLANRNAELQAEIRQARSSPSDAEQNTAAAPPPPLVTYGFRRQTSPQPVSESATLSQMRRDFLTTQQERADLQKRLDNLIKDFEGMEAKWKSDQKKVSHLASSNSAMSVKVRDREEELRGKAKLLDDVQDENATLNLQLNMAEDQIKKLKKENQELVDRWMMKKRQEADRMNDEGKFK